MANSLRTETTSWDWAMPSSASSLLACWGPFNLKQFNYKFGIWTRTPWSGSPWETWVSRSVSNALVWPVCAVLLVSVLCCLQVPFNNMRMFLVHTTLENNLKCVLCCGYLFQVPQDIKHSHICHSVFHIIQGYFIIECECDLIFCSN